MIWKTEYTGKNNMTKNLKPRLKCLQMRLVFFSFFLSFIYLFIFLVAFHVNLKRSCNRAILEWLSSSWLLTSFSLVGQTQTK